MLDEHPPRLRLDFYDEGLILHHVTPLGVQSYPIELTQLVTALSQLSITSGWLPRHTLFWRRHAGEEQIGLYVPARRWQVKTATATFHIPLPQLLFVGHGHHYSVFALKKRPIAPPFDLFHCPCPNVQGDGLICQGSAPFPRASAQTIEAALHLFLEGSLFNEDLSAHKSQRHPENVLLLWAELHERPYFPLGDLQPAQVTFQ